MIHDIIIFIAGWAIGVICAAFVDYLVSRRL